VPALVAAGVRVGLGTDGAASNNTLNLLRDMQLAALLHKGTTGDPTVLPARAMIEMATVQGAKVLGLSNRIGTLTEGSEADLICVKVEGPHTAPMYDPFSHLVFAARATDVRHVVIRGRIIVRNRALQTLDLDRIEGQVRKFSETIRSN